MQDIECKHATIPNADTVSKQATRGLHGASRHTAIRILHAEVVLVWKKILCYSCIQLRRSTYQSVCLSHCCVVKGSRSYGRLAASNVNAPYEQKLGVLQNMFISWLMVRDVVELFCRTDLTIWQSSRALFIGGRWDPAYHSIWSSTTHSFPIRMTVVECDQHLFPFMWFWRLLDRYFLVLQFLMARSVFGPLILDRYTTKWKILQLILLSFYGLLTFLNF